jgi:hypothetical protein
MNIWRWIKRVFKKEKPERREPETANFMFIVNGEIIFWTAPWLNVPGKMTDSSASIKTLRPVARRIQGEWVIVGNEKRPAMTMDALHEILIDALHVRLDGSGKMIWEIDAGEIADVLREAGMDVEGA